MTVLYWKLRLKTGIKSKKYNFTPSSSLVSLDLCKGLTQLEKLGLENLWVRPGQVTENSFLYTQPISLIVSKSSI